MTPKMQRPGAAEPVPLSGFAVQVRAHLKQRRQELYEYSPEAVGLAAQGLADGHEAAYQSMRALRGDRDRDGRYRCFQLSGERGLPFEDVACLALEPDPAGREVVLAMLRPLVRAMGYELREVDGEDGDVAAIAEAKVAASQAGADVQHELDRALADQTISADERSRTKARIARAHEALDHLEASVDANAAAAVGPRLVTGGAH